MRILVVEDDVTSRLLLRELLKPAGPLDMAVDGTEAVAAVRKALDRGRPYDLVCLDIVMPGMDGHQALEAIRQVEAARGLRAGQGSKVVMTTALSESSDVMRAFRSRADAYLVKPIDGAALRERLGELGLVVPGGR